eukprot:TRINITY_DN8213_c0_g1_i1.p1 TRINITY_DN8213_c0_g1~~TRINITY_DN8213_c0_g1_i1.p1  ORF type:complete len:332 (-),score=77.09 TRINITY_DN8213_c0_g1_i1:15-1010(-)
MKLLDTITNILYLFVGFIFVFYMYNLWVAIPRESKMYQAPGELVSMGDGHHLHLHCLGNENAKDIVLLVPGLGHPGLGLSKVQSLLSEHYIACTYDRSGLGWSDPVKDTDAYSLDVIVSELGTIVRDVVAPKGKNLYLVGHSFGGRVALEYAASQLDDNFVKGIILADPTVSTDFDSEAFEDAAQIVSFMATLGDVGILRTLFHFGVVNPVEPKVFLSNDDQDIMKYLSCKINGHWHGAAREYLLLSKLSNRTSFHSLIDSVGSLPTQIIAVPNFYPGADEALTEHWKKQYEETLKAYPNRVTALPDSTHSFVAEEADGFAAIIKEFIKSH